jgi:hypothetical protein
MTDISAARATPFWLPASHFAAGLLSLAVAAVLLPTAVADLAAGRFLQPRLVAITHLITLGWLTVSIMGALCQLFPVVLGTPLRWVRLSVLTLALFVPGVLVFVGGLLSGRSALVMVGAIVFASALVLFLVNAWATLWRARSKRDITWWTLAGAFFFLAATITFGISLAINLSTAHLQDRLTALAVHVHVALGGWVLLVVMAVGRRLLPMFLLSHGAHERPLRIAVMAMSAGALLLSLFHGFMTRPVFVVGVLLMGVGTVALVVQVVGYLRTRHRPQLDAGLRLVLAGGVLVLVALALGAVLLVTDAPMSVVAAYGAAAVGGLALFVAGHYYKILPFLLWNHRYAPLVGKRPLPRIAELFDTRVANVAGAASTVGMFLIVGGTLAQSQLIILSATLLFAIGVFIQAAQLLKLLRTRPA